MTVRAVPILDPDGAIREWIGTHMDVHEHRLAENERAELLTRLTFQIERMPLAYLLSGPDFRYTHWNPAAERIFGFSLAEALGKSPFATIVPPQSAAVVADIFASLAKGDMNAHGTSENVTKDGRTIYCEWHNTPLIASDGTFQGVLSLAQDITARKLLEEQFRQAQKMDAFGQLAGGVAHDFNNLLTIINGYSDLLLESLPESHPSRQMIAEIHKAGERSAGLTRQLLAFSRQQILATRILNLNEVVADTDKMLRRLIGEDIRLTTTLETQPWAVQADPGQVEQVLLNLAVNARDAMPKGGRLTIETKNVELDESYVRTHMYARAGPYVLLSVTDTGSGIPPEVMAKIFEPFFTTKETGKGSGLGLATVYGIVKQSGGHVTVYSEVGLGTTFKVYLPQAEQPSERSPAQSRILAPPRGTETILLAEDEAAVRALTRTILTGCGYQVLEAADGDEVVQVAAGHGGPIHLLIADVVMPGAGGRAVAERLTEQYPRMRVLYVSGYTDDAVIRHGVLREGVNFIQKPFTPAALARKVRDVLDGTKL
jgi:PAS domain S-box-containing protein